MRNTTMRSFGQHGPITYAFSDDDTGSLPDQYQYGGQFVWSAPTVSKAGHPGTPAGTVDTSTPTSTTSPGGGQSSTASPFVINVTWDASVASAPAGFEAGVLSAVQYLESQFSDPITINIGVGYGEVNGTALGSGALGQSYYWLDKFSYSQIVGALKADAKTATDASAVASLPSTANGTFWATTAQAQALGLMGSAGVNGYVGFSSTYGFDYNDADGVSGYDFSGVVLHEITEVMGRSLAVGGSIGGSSPSYYAGDLLHFSAPGVHTFTSGGYFSADNGVTNMGNYNTGGGDPGDWSSSVANDSFDATSAANVVNVVSANDLTLMDAIGWDRTGVASAPAPPPPPPPAPTGVAVSPVTTSLAAAQTAGGLAANSSLAKFSQVGGASGDSYTYVLGGTGAASFKLSSSSNVAMLAAGASGVAGATNGALYALTVTAKDLTVGTASPASRVAVIVGNSGNDTIAVATLIGNLGASTPTFIYSLAGADQINGSGMSGKLWLAGGAGADVMTGGSGVNDYLYGATTDSTGAATDIITNFHAASDLIDLTGLATSLKSAGSLPTLTGHGKKVSDQVLPAHSVGWQASGGNTFVYVNTSGSSESLASSNMKLELLGSVSLTSSNIMHL